MDATQAMNETQQIITGLISNLTPEHREMSTPCSEFTVHDLINHVCGGGHMIAAGMLGEEMGAPDGDMPDFLAEGPANGYAAVAGHLAQAATPEILAATHQMPFGEVPGEQALGVIVTDHFIHAWDLAKATGQQLQASDELVAYTNQVLHGMMPMATGREGAPFDDAVEVGDDASALDQMIAYSGRQP